MKDKIQPVKSAKKTPSQSEDSKLIENWNISTKLKK